MSVRAKLHLSSITENDWGGAKTLKFQSMYDTSIHEDQRFQKATPCASAEFQIDNPAALEQFKLGGDYYVDFTPVPKPDPVPAPTPAPTTASG